MHRTRFKNTISWLVVTLFICLPVAIKVAGQGQVRQSAQQPQVPKTWDAEAIASIEVALADAQNSPVHISGDYYYRIPVRPVYKSYPVYAPGKEPPGYWEQLRQQEPEVVFDAAKLKTEADWIKAGELVFDAPIAYDIIATVSQVRDSSWYEKTGTPLASDGVMPFARYVIRRKGQVELGTLSCAMCHTRVMADGTIIKGAQGNFPFERAVGYSIRAGLAGSVEQVRQTTLTSFDTPWLKPNPNGRFAQMSVDEIAAAHEAIPPGVIARNRSSLLYPVQVPDLIGVRERRYLDRTGINLQRNIGDMMRYAALNQGGDDLASFGHWRPQAAFGKYPEPTELDRYSDEQLYALTLYLYSLKPPPNPNKFDATAARGQKVFREEGCTVCHVPPLYTNNMLVPAAGFKVPAAHLEKYDVMPFDIGTDGALTLLTRRGTGYYKVPSLLGLWYRSPLEHSGSVMTLEDWFNPRRSQDDYVPTGFRGFGVKARAVPGHRFGLNLSTEDRTALIAFLKTL
jgi:hypothetical protein